MDHSTGTSRRLAYAVLAPLLAIISLVLALVGRADAAARYQRRLALSLVGAPTSAPERHPAPAAVLAISAIILAVGVACWLLLWLFTYAVLPLPLAACFLTLVLAGRIPAIARYQRRMASGLTGGSVPSRTGVQVAVHSIAIVAVGLICWLLLAYLLVFTVGNLASPS